MLRVRDKNVSFCKDTGAYWLNTKLYDKNLCELNLKIYIVMEYQKKIFVPDLSKDCKNIQEIVIS